MTAVTHHGDVERVRAALVELAGQQGTSVDKLKPPPGYAHLPLAIIDSVYYY